MKLRKVPELRFIADNSIENSAQISKIINAGIEISHIDSHHHIHTDFWILVEVLKLAKKYNISKISDNSCERSAKNEMSDMQKIEDYLNTKRSDTEDA